MTSSASSSARLCEEVRNKMAISLKETIGDVVAAEELDVDDENEDCVVEAERADEDFVKDCLNRFKICCDDIPGQKMKEQSMMKSPEK